MLVLAEISDKMPTFWSTLAISSIIVSIAIGLSRLWWPLVLLGLPWIVFGNWTQILELQETTFVPVIIHELGYDWIVGQFVAWNVPPVVGAILIWKLHCRDRAMQRRDSGVCQTCDYPADFAICPECGTVRQDPQDPQAPPAPS